MEIPSIDVVIFEKKFLIATLKELKKLDVDYVFIPVKKKENLDHAEYNINGHVFTMKII